MRQLESAIEAARQALLSPASESLENCQASLQEATEALGQLHSELRDAAPAEQGLARRRLRDLTGRVAQLRALLDSAQAFHGGWVRLAASLIAGYRPDGHPADPEAIRRFCLEG